MRARLLTNPRQNLASAPHREVAPNALTLSAYKALVDRCAAARLNQDIDNGSALHARILISKLFEIAEEEAFIVSGVLSQESEEGVEIYAYGDVIRNAKAFLKEPNTNLSIVVLSGEIDGGDENKFLKGIIDASDRLGTVTVYLPERGVAEDHLPHFMVVDSSAYRFENGIDAAPARKGISAVANFGDRDGAIELANLFCDVEKTLNEEKLLRETKIFRPVLPAANI